VKNTQNSYCEEEVDLNSETSSGL